MIGCELCFPYNKIFTWIDFLKLILSWTSLGLCELIPRFLLNLSFSQCVLIVISISRSYLWEPWIDNIVEEDGKNEDTCRKLLEEYGGRTLLFTGGHSLCNSLSVRWKLWLLIQPSKKILLFVRYLKAIHIKVCSLCIPMKIARHIFFSVCICIWFLKYFILELCTTGEWFMLVSIPPSIIEEAFIKIMFHTNPSGTENSNSNLSRMSWIVKLLPEKRQITFFVKQEMIFTAAFES